MACESAARADAYSTAAFVLGPRRALDWALGREGVELVVLEVAGDALRATETPGLRGRIEPLANDVELRFLELAHEKSPLPRSTPPDGPTVRARR